MRFSKAVVKYRVAILIVALALLAPAVLGMVNTRINYDMLDYLPEDMDTVIVYRNIKGVQFTPEGEYIVSYAQKCIDDYKDVKRVLQPGCERTFASLPRAFAPAGKIE